MAIIRSLKYPITLEDGGLAVSEDYDVIKEAIFNVLECRNGELIMRHDFGTPNFIFTSVPNPAVICERIRIALTSQIPNVKFQVSGNINEDGIMGVEVQWSLDNIPQPPIKFQLKL